MSKILILVVCLLLLVTLTGCAAQANGFEKTANAEGEVDGFWQGLWHGIITPVTFIISLFSDTIGFYEIYNNGNWYNLGYVIGLSIVFGGGTKSTCRKRG